MELSNNATQKIDHWIAKYPENQRQSAVLAALTIAQDDNGGHLTVDAMKAVANYLKMPEIAVFEAATFYTMYNKQPIGKHTIDVCTSISCMLRGSDALIEKLEKKLGIKLGETTPDGKITLRGAECLALCTQAPAAQIDKQYCGDLTEEKLNSLIEQFND